MLINQICGVVFQERGAKNGVSQLHVSSREQFHRLFNNFSFDLDTDHNLPDYRVLHPTFSRLNLRNEGFYGMHAKWLTVLTPVEPATLDAPANSLTYHYTLNAGGTERKVSATTILRGDVNTESLIQVAHLEKDLFILILSSELLHAGHDVNDGLDLFDFMSSVYKDGLRKFYLHLSEWLFHRGYSLTISMPSDFSFCRSVNLLREKPFQFKPYVVRPLTRFDSQGRQSQFALTAHDNMWSINYAKKALLLRVSLTPSEFGPFLQSQYGDEYHYLNRSENQELYRCSKFDTTDEIMPKTAVFVEDYLGLLIKRGMKIDDPDFVKAVKDINALLKDYMEGLHFNLKSFCVESVISN